MNLPKTHNQKLAKQGEDLACNFLTQKGFSILHKNFRTRFTEIDIIAARGDTLILVEVKTRKSDSFGLPYESINMRKKRLLNNAAHYYLSQNNNWKNIRIDIISILAQEGQAPQIDHFENIF